MIKSMEYINPNLANGFILRNGEIPLYENSNLRGNHGI